MLIDIDKIVVSDRIRKDFGNIEELAQDIQENGLINPPVVTPDNVLIAGERRVRAMKSLGYKQAEVRIMTVRDAEHQLKLEINENENRKEFTFSERIDWAKRLERIEREKARERQGTLNNIETVSLMETLPEAKGTTRDIVAEQSGFGSGKTFEKAKFISENATPELIADLDEGKLSINKAYQQLKQQLSDAESRVTNLADQLTETTEENQMLRQENRKLYEKSQRPPEDYESLKREVTSLSLELQTIQRQSQETQDRTGRTTLQLEEDLLLLTSHIQDFLRKVAPLAFLKTAIGELGEFHAKQMESHLGMLEDWTYAMRDAKYEHKTIKGEIINVQ